MWSNEFSINTVKSLIRKRKEELTTKMYPLSRTK